MESGHSAFRVACALAFLVLAAAAYASGPAEPQEHGFLAENDTTANAVTATTPIGQAPQGGGLHAAPDSDGLESLEPLGVAGQATHLVLLPAGERAHPNQPAPTSVTLFDRGLTQVLQTWAPGPEPRHTYVLALSTRSDGVATAAARRVLDQPVKRGHLQRR